MSSICAECALCCDGTIFTDVKVDAEEVVHPRLTVLPGENPARNHFAQPCTALTGCRCTIYPERPNTCARYRCQLLRAVDAGEVDEGTALTRIAATRGYRDRVRTAVDERFGTTNTPMSTLLSTFETRFAHMPVSERSTWASLVLDIGVLRMLIHTHFRAQGPQSN